MLGSSITIMIDANVCGGNDVLATSGVGTIAVVGEIPKVEQLSSMQGELSLAKLPILQSSAR